MKKFTNLSYYLLAGASVLAVTSFSNSAEASGFAIKEQSAAGQGNSFAGATANPEGLSGIFFNPAAIAKISGRQAEIGASYINVEAEYDNLSFVGTHAGAAGATSGKPGAEAVVPYAYGLLPVSDKLNIGVGLNAPFGLKTEYGTAEAASFAALTSELETMALSMVAGYDLSPKLSVGGGIILQRAEAELSTNLGATQLINEGEDDIGVGLVFGVQYQHCPVLKLGFTYKSSISHDLEGMATNTAAGLSTDVNVDVELPDSFGFGLAYQATEDLELLFDATWTRWSRFDELVLEYPATLGAIGLPGLPSLTTTENWEDTWFLSVGANYDYSDNLTFRGGVAYDQTPVPSEGLRTMRIPDEDRTWLSVGGTYTTDSGVEFSLGYSHIFVSDAKIRNNPYRESLVPGDTVSADFESSIDIISLSVGLISKLMLVTI